MNIADIDVWINELRASHLVVTSDLDLEDPDNYCVHAVCSDIGHTVAGTGRTIEEALRDALESKRLRQYTDGPAAGSRRYEATVVCRSLDSNAHKPHSRTTKCFLAENDVAAATLAAHAFRDRPGFIKGAARFIGIEMPKPARCAS